LWIAEAPLFPKSSQIYGGSFVEPAPPKHAEYFIKELHVLMAMDKQCPQGEVKIAAALNIDVLERCSNVRHAPGMHVQPGRMKEAAEVQQVME
jgi:hypothetical protein